MWRRVGLVGIVAATVCALALALANVGFAVAAPFELEIREGTVWLHVLAQSAGLSLYDGARVAFVNMNHGPLDPVIKGALHALLPSAAPNLVTRFFVMLLPLALAGLFSAATRRVLPALGVTATCLCFLFGLGAEEFLLGRSDPTALTLLCALLWVAHRPYRSETARSVLLRFCEIGVLAAGVCLTNSRYSVVVAVVGVAALLQSRRQPTVRRSIVVLAAIVAGFAAVAVWGIVVVTLFRGDIDLYYRHFVGFFTRASGWGTQGKMPFAFFPDELEDGRVLLHLALGLLCLKAWRDRRGDRVSILIGALAWLAAWTTLAWAYSRNHGAAGLQYFAPLYVVALFYVARLVRWEEKSRLVAVAAVASFVGLPWAMLWTQAADLRRVVADGNAFETRVAEITQGEQPYSEDLHLFERRYDGRVIDMGDTVAAVARRGYFGLEFSATFANQQRRLETAPPRFVLVGASIVTTPALQRLLESGRYEVAVESAPIIAVERAPVRLYRLRAK